MVTIPLHGTQLFSSSATPIFWRECNRLGFFNAHLCLSSVAGVVMQRLRLRSDPAPIDGVAFAEKSDSLPHNASRKDAFSLFAARKELFHVSIRHALSSQYDGVNQGLRCCGGLFEHERFLFAFNRSLVCSRISLNRFSPLWGVLRQDILPSSLRADWMPVNARRHAARQPVFSQSVCAALRGPPTQGVIWFVTF